MSGYSVDVPQQVEDDITRQVLFIARDSVDNALAWEQRVFKAIAMLAYTPQGYPIDPYASERTGQKLRKMVFERTYRVHYTVDHDERRIRIQSFRHGARLPNPHEP